MLHLARFCAGPLLSWSDSSQPAREACSEARAADCATLATRRGDTEPGKAELRLPPLAAEAAPATPRGMFSPEEEDEDAAKDAKDETEDRSGFDPVGWA